MIRDGWGSVGKIFVAFVLDLIYGFTVLGVPAVETLGRPVLAIVPYVLRGPVDRSPISTRST